MKTTLLKLTAAALLACASTLHAADTVEFAGDDYQLTETARNGQISLPILRTGAAFPASVRVIVDGGTAREGEDFTFPWWPLVFKFTGSTTFHLQFSDLDDGIPEGDETIILRLVDPTNGLQIGARDRCTVTLRNSPTAYSPAERFESGVATGDLFYGGPVWVNEGPNAQLPIQRTGDRDRATTVEVRFRTMLPVDEPEVNAAYLAEPARPGVDFAPGTVRVGFAPGETERMISAPVLDNGDVNARFRHLILDIPGSGVWLLVISDNERPTHLDLAHPLPPPPLVLLQGENDWRIGSTGAFPTPDGKFYVRDWRIDSVNEAARPGLARLFADGELDESFAPSDGLGEYTFRLLPSGPLLATQAGIVRLRTDGSYDDTFRPTTPFSHPTAVHVVEATDRTLWVQDGEVFHHLASDGTLIKSIRVDPAITIGGVDIEIRGLLKSVEDGALLVGGANQYDPGLWRDFTIRLRSDGTFDPDFRVPGHFLGQLRDGRFVTYDSVLNGLRVRLFSAEGEADASFPPLHLSGLEELVPPGFSGGDAPFLKTSAAFINGLAPVSYPMGRGIDFYGRSQMRLRLTGLPRTSLILLDAAQGVPSGNIEEPTSNDVASFKVSFYRLGSSAGTATVNYTTRDVTATAGKDYVAQSGTITFAPLETEKTVLIPLLADGERESDEVLEVVVTGAEGIEEIPTVPMRLTILGELGARPHLDRAKRLRDGRMLLGTTRDLPRNNHDGTYKPVSIEHSQDLNTWHPLTNVVSGFGLYNLPVWLDASATNAPTRYYRAVVP